MEEQYEQAVKALKELAPEQNAPTLRSIKDSLTDKQRKYIDKHNGMLVISPAITEDFTFKDLLTNYDKKQKKSTYIYKDLWDQYDLKAPMKTSFVLVEGDNFDFGVYSNQTLEKQRDSLKKTKKSLNGLDSLSVRE